MRPLATHRAEALEGDWRPWGGDKRGGRARVGSWGDESFACLLAAQRAARGPPRCPRCPRRSRSRSKCMLCRCALASSATSADAALRHEAVLRVSCGAVTAVPGGRGRVVCAAARPVRARSLDLLLTRPARRAQKPNFELPGRGPTRVCVRLAGLHVCRPVGSFQDQKLDTDHIKTKTRPTPADRSRKDEPRRPGLDLTARVPRATMDFRSRDLRTRAERSEPIRHRTDAKTSADLRPRRGCGSQHAANARGSCCHATC